MATINLRPWREERKERLKKEFGQVTLLFVIMAALIWGVWNRAVDSIIDHQESRNRLLQTEIDSLDQKVKEINELKRKKGDLIERMKVIQGLQGTRPLIVHLFDELAKNVPDGMFFSTVSRKGTQVTIRGTAESNSRVSSLMRSLDESDYFSDPNLTKVTSNSDLGEQGNDFVLTVHITTLDDKEEGQE